MYSLVSRLGFATPKSRFVSVSKNRVSTPPLVANTFSDKSDAVCTVSIKSFRSIITWRIAKFFGFQELVIRLIKMINYPMFLLCSLLIFYLNACHIKFGESLFDL